MPYMAPLEVAETETLPPSGPICRVIEADPLPLLDWPPPLMVTVPSPLAVKVTLAADLQLADDEALPPGPCTGGVGVGSGAGADGVGVGSGVGVGGCGCWFIGSSAACFAASSAAFLAASSLAFFSDSALFA